MVYQPKGTRDGTRGMRGRVVYTCHCLSERCGRTAGAFVKRDKARRERHKMEEEGCLVEIREWTLS